MGAAAGQGMPGSSDFAKLTITLAGHRLVADRSGALYWPSADMLIVADLHLEKGSAFARRGAMLPPYDTAETLSRLNLAIARYAPRRVVALGDSLHDRDAEGRLSAQARETLSALQRGRSWVWVTGNHDPLIGPSLGGEVVDDLVVDGVFLRHIPRAGHGLAEIAGHMHPAARVVINGSSLRRPCFAGDENRVIVPAFGAFAGGLNVCDAAFAALIAPKALKIWMLGRDGVYPVATCGLRPD